MIVILVDGPAAPGETVELPADEVRHLKVRRVGEERVQLRDGHGFMGAGVVTREAAHLFVKVEDAVTVAAPPALTLAIGAGDRERFAVAVEKSAELGVTRVVPVATARTMSVATRVRDDQLVRLRRRGREAIKQSGAAWAPLIDEVTPLEQFIDRHPDLEGDASGGVRWLADAVGAPPPCAVATGAPIIVLVGPEGGLTSEEKAAAFARGFVPVWLAHDVLRFETAAIAAAAAASAARRRGSS